MMMLELVRLLRTSKWKYLIFIIIVSIAYKQLIYTETGTSMGIAQADTDYAFFIATNRHAFVYCHIAVISLYLFAI